MLCKSVGTALLTGTMLFAASPSFARCRCATVYSRQRVAGARVRTSGTAERSVTERTEAARPAELERITLPTGTRIPIRVDQSLDTKRDEAGTPFAGHVDAALARNGVIVVPRGAPCEGHLVASRPSGRLKGHALMVLELDSVTVNGRRYRLVTGDQAFASRSHKRRNLAIIGGSAAGGAAVGVVAGDGIGAAVGAGAGAVAGTVGAFVTGRKNLHIAPETRVTFALERPVRVRV